MASIQQPLLDTHKSCMLKLKNFFIFISLSAIIFSAVVLVPNLIKPTDHLDLSVTTHICNRARDPEECLSLVSDAVSDGVVPSDGVTLLQRFLVKYVEHLGTAVQEADRIKSRINGHYEHAALADCLELLDSSIDRVTDSVAALPNRTDDAQAWLSAVLTNHVTCLDGLHGPGRSAMEALVEDLISRARASLAMLVAVAEDSEPGEEMPEPIKGRFPPWIMPRDRKLLESSAKDIKADVVVARDGSGNYRTVAEAVASAPDKSKKRYVIYVKSGTYKENVEVGKKKKKVMIVGDGMEQSIITGSLSFGGGSTTFKSATLAAVGEGFILQDIWVKNTAGPEKHQAVALRVGADQSIINRCKIDAYQDTLYAHSLRQFYRDCYVIGTIDFIFGNAAVVLQNCKLEARKPMESQKNMVTAQGRTDPNQSTGTSIQNCDIVAGSDLAPAKGSFPTYLGRPWKEYSRTVVMQTYIEDHIDPAGWAPWSGEFALRTLYYGEYMNRGPGAGTSQRVNWPGYHVITDPAEAMNFTVAGLIQGGEWLKSTGVAYTEGL